MSDLYNRLEEIQEMTRTLIEDVECLLPNLGSRSITDTVTTEEEANRRFYVRAIFSLVETVVEQHKRLLLELHEHNFIKLHEGVYEVLSERVYIAKDNGKILSKEQYLKLQRKIRTVYRVASESFKERLNINFGDSGWELFQDALKIRDRITHPKRYEDCEIDEQILEVVESGEKWFRNLNNEFVRIARLHRNKFNW